MGCQNNLLYLFVSSWNPWIFSMFSVSWTALISFCWRSRSNIIRMSSEKKGLICKSKWAWFSEIFDRISSPINDPSWVQEFCQSNDKKVLEIAKVGKTATYQYTWFWRPHVPQCISFQGVLCASSICQCHLQICKKILWNWIRFHL